MVEREKVTTMTVVGDAMARPLADELEANPDKYDLSSFFALGSGGAILSAGVKEQFTRVRPDLIITDAFGASETGANGGGVGSSDEGHPRFAVNDSTAVLDEDHRPVEPGSGVKGMLARSGRIPLGYYKDEEKTARTFVHDADGKRWVIPGDFATVEADGTITLFGRGSVSINSGGEKIFPEEVEAALKSHPAVFDAIVVGVPDERFGQRVAAVVAPRPGDDADPRGAGRARPHQDRRLQGPPRAAPGRRRHPQPERQGRLPLGQVRRHRRGLTGSLGWGTDTDGRDRELVGHAPKHPGGGTPPSLPRFRPFSPEPGSRRLPRGTGGGPRAGAHGRCPSSTSRVAPGMRAARPSDVSRMSSRSRSPIEHQRRHRDRSERSQADGRSTSSPGSTDARARAFMARNRSGPSRTPGPRAPTGRPATSRPRAG